jgi:hypothetical protein
MRATSTPIGTRPNDFFGAFEADSEPIAGGADLPFGAVEFGNPIPSYVFFIVMWTR